MTNTNRLNASIRESSLHITAVSFLHLPSEIHLHIASYLKQCDLLPLVQACKLFHKIFTPLVWGHIGFTPPNYKPPGRQFKLNGPCLSNHVSPHVSKFVNNDIEKPLPLDKLSYLLLLNNISKATLACIKSVTLCSGYDFLNIMNIYEDRDPSDPEFHGSLNLVRSSQGYYLNKLAAVDLAIYDVYSDGKFCKAKSQSYTSIFRKAEDLELWEQSLRAAEPSIMASSSFPSGFLSNQLIRVGPPKKDESEITELPCLSDVVLGTNSLPCVHSLSDVVSGTDSLSCVEMVEMMVLNRFHFRIILKERLLIPSLPNLSNIFIDIGSSFNTPLLPTASYTEMFTYRCGVDIISTLSQAVVHFPSAKIAFNFSGSYSGALLRASPLKGLSSHINIVRAMVVSEPENITHFTRFLSDLTEYKTLEKLEFITQVFSQETDFLTQSDRERIIEELSEVLKNIPTLTTFHLSSAPLMSCFLAALPKLSIPTLELRFTSLRRSEVELFFSQPLEGTTCLRVDHKSANFRIPKTCKIGFTGLEELHLRHFKLARSTQDEILRKNPGLKKITFC